MTEYGLLTGIFYSRFIDQPKGVSQMSLTLENFIITLMLEVAEFPRIQWGLAIL